MRYFDGMGNDKTAYVLGLEERISELELLLCTPEAAKTETPKIKVVEVKKENASTNPKRKRNTNTIR